MSFQNADPESTVWLQPDSPNGEPVAPTSENGDRGGRPAGDWPTGDWPATDIAALCAWLDAG